MPILDDFHYHAPATIPQALGLLKKKKGAVLLAGGTFVLNYLKKSPRMPSDVVSLRRVAGLSCIKETTAEVTIGAMMTVAELAASPIIQKSFPSLAQACRQLGTTPVRNMATIGGNVSSRFFWADLPTVLLSLDARLVLATPSGKKTVPFDKIYAKKPAGPYLLTHIMISKGRNAAFYFRHTRTGSLDIPMLSLALAGFRRGKVWQDVRCVLNTTTALPLVATFSGSPEEIRRGLEEYCAGRALDPFRRRLLSADMATL